VIWTVEFQEAYELWEAQTDPIADCDLRITTLEYVHSWQEDGPPIDGEFDPNRLSYRIEVPGAGVEVEYVVYPYVQYPTIVVSRFRR
jgi:hypothetical protein